MKDKGRGGRIKRSNKLPTERSPLLDNFVSHIPEQPLSSSSSGHYYEDFTTIDWVHDSVEDSYRRAKLKEIKGIRGKIIRLKDASQGWILVIIIALVFALIAYAIDRIEGVLSDYKQGYCRRNILLDKATCEEEWIDWNGFFEPRGGGAWIEFFIYTSFSIIFALASVGVTLVSKNKEKDGMYTAAGSGVAEVKTILSGFVIRGYLGIKTLVVKSIGLCLSIASGLSIGKEGPYVHMAACVGNIACRLCRKYNLNDGKRREIISAAVSAGVALAFGSPIGGVLFSLEEVSYYFPTKTMFRAYFCALMTGLFLKVLNPYGTGHIVMFEVHYTRDWRAPELMIFILIGVCGGIFGGLFCLMNNWIGQLFKRIKLKPGVEVAIISVITSIVCFPSLILRKPVDELLYSILTECKYGDQHNQSLVCPTVPEIPKALASLGYGFLVKYLLTTVTIGVAKVPAGLYVPIMIVGALFGKIIGLVVQYIHYKHPGLGFFASCPPNYSSPLECTITGVYGLAGAGAFMAGATRMTITLAVILFELTGSMYHVVPFSIAILVSRWVANSIDRQSVYGHQIENKNFPFLDNNQTRGFDSSLDELLTTNSQDSIKPDSTVVLDTTESNYISNESLKDKALHVQSCQSALPVVCDGRLVGVISGPELDMLIDKGGHPAGYYVNDGSGGDSTTTGGQDLSPYIDKNPLTIDLHAPVSLVYILFTKLGLGLIVVLDKYDFYTVLYRKQFINLLRPRRRH